MFNTLANEFAEAPKAQDLFKAFLQSRSYSRSLLLKLLDVARGNQGDAWEIRRLAVLMMERQVLTIPPDNIEEFDFLLTQLKLKPAPGLPFNVNVTVLQEGYSTTDLREFIFEFRRKLGRLSRAYDLFKGRRINKRALLDFIALSRSECKLSLARYVFQPDEVFARILEHVRISHGIVDLNPSQPSVIAAEDAHTVSLLPAYEARILERLRDTHRIYWVSDRTPSALNSLVEYPLTTVVLVVKPPGSHLEFEIKRAGRRGRCPLGVVHRRESRLVPPSHRLDGGSAQGLLRYEAHSVSRLSSIYRLAHDAEAPFSTFHSRSSIYDIPAADRVENALDYFTDPRIFGAGFGQMRAAMKASVASFDEERGAQMANIPGDLGLTLQFLSHAAPAQAIISGTSSFRLDRLAAYLADDGPETYFADGLRVPYSKLDARRLADEVLEEALCVYRPPAVGYRSHRQYLRAALKVSANRERADHNFLSAMRQIGKFWGTLLAVRGNTNGESFVPRNVGLRSVWMKGRWQLNVIFMDHDNLNLADTAVENFQSLGAHAGTALDELYIWGIYDDVRHVIGAADCLAIIYRAGKELFQRGRASCCEAMAAAYKKTHRALKSKPELRGFFHPSFVERIRDWDAIVSSYLKIKDAPAGLPAWKEKTMRKFIRRGYDKNVVLEHLIAAERYSKFLARYSFLY